MSNPEYTVFALFTASEQSAPMEFQPFVEAEAGKGLMGDRYHTDIQQGYWQIGVSKPRETIRHISIISKAAVDESRLEYDQPRRNVIADIPAEVLKDMVGKEFTIGEVNFRGSEECTPCDHPLAGFGKEFRGKGGLRAEILSSGRIYPGDQIVIFSQDEFSA